MISKKDSSTAVVQNSEHEIRRIEQQLDKSIGQYGSATADVGRPSKAVLNEIRRKYEDGGWNVKINDNPNPHDQRDGVLIELS